MQYSHTQPGTVIISVIGIIIVFILVLYLTSDTIQPWEALLGIFLILVLYLFSSLTVEIRDRSIICYFGPGLIRKKIELSTVSEVQAVQNCWWSGWGIRWMPGQYWLWNVSGFRAVELTLKNSKRFRIGTDEPDLLVKAIQSNMMAAT